MIPILKHPVSSVKYMCKMTVPAISLFYISEKYRKTQDSRFAGVLDCIGEDMKEIIRDCYSSIAPERINGLVEDLEAEISRLKS